jgi:PhzF family phenazine biosynthesis protein
MKLDLFQIDAFTNKVFGGNPACVVPLNEWLADDILLHIAKENAVPETAFFVRLPEGYHLRWFTPEFEMDLCGHATLATAHALKAILRSPENQFRFTSRSGYLTVSEAGGLYTLDFPARRPVAAILPDTLQKAIHRQPVEVLKARDYVLVYDTEEEVRNIRIDRQIFDQLNIDPGGVIVTAKGEKVDFVSRFFVPQASIFEDPVTGSAHCSLIPYWSEKLGKKEMKALQVSERVGELWCVNNGERVFISGNAVTYSIGTLQL